MTIPHHSARLGLNDVYVIDTRDGSNTLYHRQLDATYHSMFGAVSESRHVFIREGLEIQTAKSEIHVLEFGFGTGLNAFLSFLFSQQHEIDVNYVGIESFPITIEVARRLEYPGYLHAIAEQNVFLQMHAVDSFSQRHYSFRKHSSLEMVNEDQSFDCIFYDAFAPGDQPELWTQAVFDALFLRTSTGGCLVTYCAQGEVRRRLQHSGFHVDRIPGPPGKREMLRAIRS